MAYGSHSLVSTCIEEDSPQTALWVCLHLWEPSEGFAELASGHGEPADPFCLLPSGPAPLKAEPSFRAVLRQAHMYSSLWLFFGGTELTTLPTLIFLS